MKLFTRIFILLGALLFSQLPLFISAYTQQLSGRVAELKLQRDALLRIAQQSGKTLDQYIYKFLNSTDPDFHGQGEWMQATLKRFQAFSESLNSLKLSSPWQKPLIFFKDFNLEVGQATIKEFSAGLPLTLEGAAYAAAGALFGWIVFLALRQLCRAVAAPFRRKAAGA